MRTAQRLEERQIKQLKPNTVPQLLRRETTPRLAKFIMQHSREDMAWSDVQSHLVDLVLAGRKGALELLIESATNQKNEFRFWPLHGLVSLTECEYSNPKLRPIFEKIYEQEKVNGIKKLAIQGLMDLAHNGDKAAQAYLTKKGFTWR